MLISMRSVLFDLRLRMAELGRERGYSSLTALEAGQQSPEPAYLRTHTNENHIGAQANIEMEKVFNIGFNSDTTYAYSHRDFGNGKCFVVIEFKSEVLTVSGSFIVNLFLITSLYLQ